MRRIAVLALCLGVLIASPALAQSKADDPEAQRQMGRSVQQGRRRSGRGDVHPRIPTVLPPGAANGQRQQCDRRLLVQACAAARRHDPEGRGRARASARARRAGSAPFTRETKVPAAQQVVGKYVVVWRKIGGRWLYATNIWNADK